MFDEIVIKCINENFDMLKKAFEYSNNNYNAMNLYTQLKKRGIKPTEESPVRISLKGLELEEDNDSYYGLVHILTYEAEILQDKRYHVSSTTLTY